MKSFLFSCIAAIHGTHMANTYDFYKPKLDSEYPEVDGPLTLTTYLTALDASYARFREKTAKAAKKSQPGVASATGSNGHANGSSSKKSDPKSIFSLDNIDFPVFHSPYGKFVQKSHARLMYNDFLAAPSQAKFASVPSPDSLLDMTYKASLTDKNLEKTFVGLANAAFKQDVLPSMACAKRCGNMYTASLYGGLASLLSAVAPAQLQGKRISMFAFGSGCASSFYTLRVKGDVTEIHEKMDLLNRLKSMKVVPVQEYVDAMKLREDNHNAGSYSPSGSLDNIWPGAFYLEHIDEKYRRQYLRKPVASSTAVAA